MSTLRLPNLFDYATKELSQDAFICWLLRWGDPSFAAHNSDLHRCARTVLAEFYAAANRAVPSPIHEVIIHRQHQNIDIWVEIRSDNRSYAVLIEDKVGTGTHSGQLTRYRDSMTKKGYDNEHLLCIFLKTFDQCDYTTIQAEGFHLFDRNSLLKCIRPSAPFDNAILHDFYHRMQSIEDSVERFRMIPIAQWEGLSWVGFYKALRLRMPAVTWGRVNNVGGGYWGCWWGWTPGGPYFQLRQQQAALCVTADGNGATRRQRQMQWHQRALELARDLALPLVRPKHMRVGTSMTIAIVEFDYRQVDANGLIDLDATVAFLRRFDELGKANWNI